MVACLTCNDSNTCISCNNFYYINNTINKCLLCNTSLSNCVTCSSNLTCLTCIATPNIILYNSTCRFCSKLMAHCVNCITSTNCTLCDPTYIVNNISPSTCTLCSLVMFGCYVCTSYSTCTKCSVGWEVINGCSSVPGCIQVMQRLPSPSLCNLCNTTEFYPTPLNGACLCLNGHLAGLYCTTMPGCTKIIRNSTGLFCTACNSGSNFVHNGSSCECI